MSQCSVLSHSHPPPRTEGPSSQARSQRSVSRNSPPSPLLSGHDFTDPRITFALAVALIPLIEEELLRDLHDYLSLHTSTDYSSPHQVVNQFASKYLCLQLAITGIRRLPYSMIVWTRTCPSRVLISFTSLGFSVHSGTTRHRRMYPDQNYTAPIYRCLAS